ncbi:hypothetical protein TROPICALSUN_8 [Erwinia phage vB_EamM_TropicalSun]|uniref:Uncharacterized protein n=4 Tax=Myosmarvirus TaxID=2843428 RepID=A0A9E8G0W3_9CAUD|nr:hypothetical protein HWC56_gp085 [Serratia phage MyoSmar]QEG09534.1 hypothetical protein CPT_MyoSmar_085 [Serratia phage MyoSmar]QEG13799.1 hypothetical protein TROPICALSUN_8 [Erwinia phage vB_EamM_TropicalSun]UZS00409.1 hypothetical protein [Serratia phage SMP]
MNANELIPFKEQPDHLQVVQYTGDGFTRLYFYSSHPMDFAFFITKKVADRKSFTVEYLTNIESGEVNREERAVVEFPSSAKLVEFINFKLTMLIKDGF